MNKTAIKNFAIWARNKLIAEIIYKAGLLGITEKEIKSPLPQSSKDVQFFDIGTREPYSITGVEIEQRAKLVEAIKQKDEQSDYKTAFKSVVEEVAYTWFNRLIAVRFMEVNDYLPSRIRVLSSESGTKIEPDLVTTPFDAALEYTPYEKDRIMQLKDDNKLDELFRMLFIKQCNTLNAILPELFEKTNDYTELLLNISFKDKDGVVYHLVHDITEDNFNVEKEGQVEIIGWLYQYYNTEPKEETFALMKKNVKITKERIPAATQLFTPDWIVRYMVENSLGRLWLEGHPNDALKSEWKYYLDEAEQEVDVQKQLEAIREEFKTIKPEDIKVIDPCMGSGHILVYAFDVLMQIYESCGYSQRDAAKSIVEHNIYGLDIDNRAYQLACFAVKMKARQYNRRILNDETECHVYSIQESNGINRNLLKYFGTGMSDIEKHSALTQINYLLDTMRDAKEYGSILNVNQLNWELIKCFVDRLDINGQMTLDSIGLEDIQRRLRQLIEIAVIIVLKYDVVVTNPPYMGNRGVSVKLSNYMRDYYADSKNDLFSVFTERCRLMTKTNAYYALITQPSILFLSSFEKLRNIITDTQSVISVLHMGRGIFGIDFGSVSFVVKNTSTGTYRGQYFKLYERTFQYIEPEDIEELYFAAKKNHDYKFNFSTYIAKEDTSFESNEDDINSSGKEQKIYYAANQANFLKLPGYPFAYWASDKTIEIFSTGAKLENIAEPRAGMQTGENEKFVRLWYEVPYNKFGYYVKDAIEANESGCKWFRYNKGGDFRKWYGNNIFVVDWENDGQNIKADKLYKLSVGKCLPSNSKPKNMQYYFKESITWSFVSSTSFGVRYSAPGAIFDIGGSSVFPEEKFNYILGFLGSKLSFEYMKIQNPTMNFQVGNVANLPILYNQNFSEKVEEIAIENVDISKTDWDMFEMSYDFITHPLLKYKTSNLIIDSFNNWKEFTSAQFTKLQKNEEELNQLFIEIYGLKNELTADVDDKNITIRIADLSRDIQSLISYAVGCMFGRYSLNVEGLAFAGGEWYDTKYSTFIPNKDNILPITDEEYFEDDIVGLFCVFLIKTFGTETLEENLDFIAKALGNKGKSSREIIRNYFLNDFFNDHCKIYQKRPIYWMFDSGRANGFKVLVYMHRYNADTIGNLRIDYLHRMQRIYDSEIVRMQETIDNSGNTREVTAATKRKEKLTKQLKETQKCDEKIAHLALARISIDLDDGVKVNYEKVQTGTDGKKLEVLAKI